MECGWATLQKQIQRAESLDEMVEAHHQFLDTLIARLAWSLLEVHWKIDGSLESSSWPPGNSEPQGFAWWAVKRVTHPATSHLWQVFESDAKMWWGVIYVLFSGFWNSKQLQAGSTRRQWWSGTLGRSVFYPDMVCIEIDGQGFRRDESINYRRNNPKLNCRLEQH